MLGYVRDIRNEAPTELIILGDLVDLWMYPPRERPPKLSDIIKANPDIFGDNGALTETVEALNTAGGKTTYITGNHDMFITQEDVSKFTNSNSKIQTGQRVYIPDADKGKGQIVCTHGHIFSLFNAQDYTSYPPKNHKGLPLGYFISRLGALWTAQELKKQGKKNSAQLPDNGDPRGWRFYSEAVIGLLESFLEDKDHISELIMAALSEATGKADDSFTMYENKVMLNAVEDIYKALYWDYPDSTKTKDLTELIISFGDSSSFFALMETDMDNKIDHFAKELAKEYPLIVMGHTHIPMLHYDEFLFHQKALYANSGFWCPSVPDMQDKGRYPTFAEVEIEDRQFTVSVKQVVKQGDDYVIQSHMGPMSIAMR